jgi:hypothetical protein
MTVGLLPLSYIYVHRSKVRDFVTALDLFYIDVYWYRNIYHSVRSQSRYKALSHHLVFSIPKANYYGKYTMLW